MRTKQLILALAVAILSSSAALAQSVELGLVDAYPVINCDGMPSETYTTTSKGNTEAELKTKEANATLYKRFAVAKSDNGTSLTWSATFAVCSSLGSGWRVPTQRELMLIWVLKTELERTAGFTPFPTTTALYWSGYSPFSGSAWNVDFANGTTKSYGTTYSSTTRVRCVREL